MLAESKRVEGTSVGIYFSDVLLGANCLIDNLSTILRESHINTAMNFLGDIGVPSGLYFRLVAFDKDVFNLLPIFSV